MDAQFYPTPPALAARMWAKLEGLHLSPVLEPHAGDGALAEARPRDYYGKRLPLDVIELDASKHPLLRAKGHRVVGLDFLAFEGGAGYQAVVMNPPFAQGARHVLKAWDMLWEGHIVAQLNAETLRNPFSEERRRLVEMVAKYGSVEYIEDAYRGPDVERKADVEIALVHLIKPAEESRDWIGPTIANLSKDDTEEKGFVLPGELALPEDYVVTQVRNFRCAVRAMREAVKAQAVATTLAARIGGTMAERNDRRNPSGALDPAGLSKALQAGYEELKDRAWASVLRSTKTLELLSSKAQKQAEAQFEDIKTLEFNVTTVYGFLLGLAQAQPELQDAMCDEVFDLISRYHADNGALYHAWKSNSRHRTMGMRIKMTRFILPYFNKSFGDNLDFASERQLADIDRVFALMDGKRMPEFGVLDAFRKHFRDLKGGARISTSYMDIRWYPGVGTVHFFPRRKDVLDRLNRTVGRRRAWLPPMDEQASKTFWKAFDKAEKLDPEIRASAKEAVQAYARSVGGHWSHNYDPVSVLFRSGDRDQNRERAEAYLVQAAEQVLRRHDLLDALEHSATLALPAPASTPGAAMAQHGALVDTAQDLAALAL